MKREIDLPLLLPDIPTEHDACVARLRTALAARDGVYRVHLTEATGDVPARVCIHYDDASVSIERIEAIARQVGAQITGRYRHRLWRSDDLTDPRRANKVVARVERIRGVEEAGVTAGGQLHVAFDSETTSDALVGDALVSMGLMAVDGRVGPPDGEAHEHGGLFGAHSELVFALASGALLAGGFLVSLVAEFGQLMSAVLYAGACLAGGWFTAKDAFESVRAGRFEIDFLMLVAAVGALALGQWGEAALLLFLFSLGHALEHYAMGRARRAIESLAELTPRFALVLRGGSEKEISVDELRVGDTVLVKPDSRLPADGFVLKGTSSINEGPITGESLPVDKRPVEETLQDSGRTAPLPRSAHVFAGTINGSGALEIRVTRVAADTTLGRVVQMVNEAETQKSPTQRLTDRFETVFVPVVLLLVVVLHFAWLVVDESFAESFYRAMAVLVASSPCALAIATPSAVLSAVARAGRSGVLIKGGGPLENLGTVRAIAFDKTGTLTKGEPCVTDVVPIGGAEETELLRVAAAVESLSDHPLAAAVVTASRERLGDETLPKASGLKSITGYGIEAHVGVDSVQIGSAALFDNLIGTPLPEALRCTVEELERSGRTTMVVRRGDRFLGTLGLMDTERPEAAEVIRHLRTLGIRRTIMLSGDNGRVAKAVGRSVGLDDAWGGLLPQDKVDAINKLREEEGKVAMVGDGVNDAPAMAHATVSVAMGAAGSDVALETADVALMADDLRQIPFAVGLSRQASRIIKQNLWVSLGVVALLVPATISGLGIGAAVAMHEGSTLVVVVNALRLLAYKPPAPRSQ